MVVEMNWACKCVILLKIMWGWKSISPHGWNLPGGQIIAGVGYVVSKQRVMIGGCGSLLHLQAFFLWYHAYLLCMQWWYSCLSIHTIGTSGGNDTVGQKTSPAPGAPGATFWCPGSTWTGGPSPPLSVTRGRSRRDSGCQKRICGISQRGTFRPTAGLSRRSPLSNTWGGSWRRWMKIGRRW